MLRLLLLLTRFSLCFLQLITLGKDLAVTIREKGVLRDIVEVKVIIIVKEAKEHLY